MLDRDYYQEHWAEKVLGIKPKAKPGADPAPDDRGPIYVNRAGTAARSMHADPRMQAVYEYRRANAMAWRRIGLRIAAVLCLVLVLALSWRMHR